MNAKHQYSKEIQSKNPSRAIYDQCAGGVGFVSVITPEGNESIGSCFHIGDGVFITAKHVVEDCVIKRIGTTLDTNKYFETEETQQNGSVRVERIFSSKDTSNFEGPYFHPNEKIDVAALIVPDIGAPILSLGSHLDDWFDRDFILTEAIVMGYPPIPFSSGPQLIASKCEVNAVVDKYTGGHPHFILSTMARGGFSGGPAISEYGFVLGVVTESLINNNQPIELGYLSVLSVEAIYGCISHNRIVPEQINKDWKGFWSNESITVMISRLDSGEENRGENISDTPF